MKSGLGLVASSNLPDLSCVLPWPVSPPSVPAAVGEVMVSNNGRMDFLSVSWRPAPGEVDNYLVSLSDGDKTLHTVYKSSSECVFNSLVSGRLYNISISSRSGIYQNHTVIQERTRMYTNTHRVIAGQSQTTIINNNFII